MKKTDEISLKNKDCYVAVFDSDGDIIYQDDFDLGPDEECLLDVDVPDNAAFPLKVKILTKGGNPNVKYRQDNFDSYDSGWVNLPESGGETQKAEER